MPLPLHSILEKLRAQLQEGSVTGNLSLAAYTSAQQQQPQSTMELGAGHHAFAAGVAATPGPAEGFAARQYGDHTGTGLLGARSAGGPGAHTGTLQPGQAQQLHQSTVELAAARTARVSSLLGVPSAAPTSDMKRVSPDSVLVHHHTSTMHSNSTRSSGSSLAGATQHELSLPFTAHTTSKSTMSLGCSDEDATVHCRKGEQRG